MDIAWRRVSSDTVIRDRWIDVRADRCVTAKGTEVSPYYVLTYPDWVNVVALTPQRDLLLVRQYRHAVEQAVLELPGGMMEADDVDPEQSARRELMEETGYVSERWLRIATLFPNPATHSNRVHSFLALDAVPRHGQRLDAGEEGLTVSSMPLDAALDGLSTGLLGQAMHVAALTMAARLIDKA